MKRRHPGAKLTLCWIPGRRDLEGNEHADQEAKRAARDDSSPPDSLPRYLTQGPLPASLSKVRQALSASFHATARTEWALSPRATPLSRIDDSLPSKRFIQLTAPLPRCHASLLIQLHTGHALLNYHLHCIATNKDEAAMDEQHWVEKSRWRVYTDGSDVDGGVGAAAVLITPGTAPKTLRYHLGPSTDHSVYEGELVGLALGMELLHRERTCHAASCAADNTASLRATQNRKPHPAHYLVDELIQQIGTLQKRHPGIALTLRWVPGHKGIEGNELADIEAKKAARGDSSPAEDLPGWLRKRGTLPRSVSKARQTINTEITRQAKEEWRRSPRATRMDRIDNQMPSKTYRKLAERLPRRQASILIQLRTEHVPLQKYLHRIKKVDSPMCEQCGATPETVYHFLRECPAYEEQRRRLDGNAGATATQLRTLLNTPRAMTHLFRYIHDTGRFHTTYGDLTLHTASESRKQETRRRTETHGAAGH